VRDEISGMFKKSDKPLLTPLHDRLVSLDALRGLAVLGMLLINIQGFSMISTELIYPNTSPDLTGLNKAIWFFSYIFADQKFLIIFSCLFGASIILFTSRIDRLGGQSLRLHYRRSFWLLLIGLVHGYFFWYGDILVPYALCSLFVVYMRKQTAPILLISGLLLIAVPQVLYTILGYDWISLIYKWLTVMHIDFSSFTHLFEQELTLMRGSWMDQMPLRFAMTLNGETYTFLIYSLWRFGGLMLIGMGLFKWQVFSGSKSTAFTYLLYRNQVNPPVPPAFLFSLSTRILISD
jgi:uncharacterized protein